MDDFRGTRIWRRSTGRGDGTFIHSQTWKRNVVFTFFKIYTALSRKKKKKKNDKEIESLKHRPCRELYISRYKITKLSGTPLQSQTYPMTAVNHGEFGGIWGHWECSGHPLEDVKVRLLLSRVRCRQIWMHQEPFSILVFFCFKQWQLYSREDT